MEEYPYRIPFLNTWVDSVTVDEAVWEVDRLIRAEDPKYVVTPNSDIIVKMQEDYELKTICDNADLILTDGMVLVRISERTGNPIKERVCMTDFVWDVGCLAVARGYRIFMFGGREDVLAEAVRNYGDKLPGLDICGSYSPPMGFENDESAYETAILKIKEAAPDILLVFLGCPKQEKFIARAKTELNVPISIPMGGCVDFLADRVKRAPKWMQNHSLEWLFRLSQDPKRLFKRYLVDDMAIFKLVKHHL